MASAPRPETDMAASIGRLPPEILFYEIVPRLDRKSLSALASSSREFNHRLQPLLFRNINIVAKPVRPRASSYFMPHSPNKKDIRHAVRAELMELKWLSKSKRKVCDMVRALRLAAVGPGFGACRFETMPEKAKIQQVQNNPELDIFEKYLEGMFGVDLSSQYYLGLWILTTYFRNITIFAPPRDSVVKLSAVCLDKDLGGDPLGFATNRKAFRDGSALLDMTFMCCPSLTQIYVDYGISWQYSASTAEAYSFPLAKFIWERFSATLIRQKLEKDPKASRTFKAIAFRVGREIGEQRDPRFFTIPMFKGVCQLIESMARSELVRKWHMVEDTDKDSRGIIGEIENEAALIEANTQTKNDENGSEDEHAVYARYSRARTENWLYQGGWFSKNDIDREGLFVRYAKMCRARNAAWAGGAKWITYGGDLDQDKSEWAVEPETDGWTDEFGNPLTV